MEEVRPERLFVGIVKTAKSLAEALDRFYTEGIPVPSELQTTREDHLRYVYGLSEKGILWAGGPSADGTTGMSVYAASSLEEAKTALRNDPYYVHGLFYDDQYFEWVLHAPLNKANPAHKERLEKSYRDLGIIP